MAHVQRPGGVGRDELNENVLAPVGLAAKAVALREHFAHDLLLGSGFEAQVQEAGASDFHRIHPLLEGRRRLQRRLQLLAQRARVGLEWFGQLHGSGHGIVAMGGHLGRLERGALARAGRQFIQLASQSCEQIHFDLQHI